MSVTSNCFNYKIFNNFKKIQFLRPDTSKYGWEKYSKFPIIKQLF